MEVKILSSKLSDFALCLETITRDFSFTFGIKLGSESSDFGVIALRTI